MHTAGISLYHRLSVPRRKPHEEIANAHRCSETLANSIAVKSRALPPNLS